MPQLIYQRCQNHQQREAIARCPECRGHFCRECISEHEERVICAACLRKLAPAGSSRGPRFGWLAHPATCILGLILAWLFFYAIGEVLLQLPDSFHEGTLWKDNWRDEK